MADDTRRFIRGAAATHLGVQLAPAFDAREGFPPGNPDRLRWFVLSGEAWRLVDLRDIARRAKLTLPIELTHSYFAHALADWLPAAARFIAKAAALPAPQPATEAPRFWWIND